MSQSHDCIFRRITRRFFSFPSDTFDDVIVLITVCVHIYIYIYMCIYMYMDILV